MRRFLISMLAAALLTLASLGSALGHVHPITPLGCNDHDNGNSGGLATNGTPADDANDGPIAGVIPFGTGNAEGKLGEGGQHSVLCD